MVNTGWELGEESGETSLRAADVECLISAVMHGAMANGTTANRIRSIFSRVRPIFGADVEYQVHLGIRLDRDPAPLLLDRMWYGEVYDQIEPRPIATFQRMMDDHAFAMQARVERVRRTPHRAYTSTMNELIGVVKADEIRRKVLGPLGFHDAMISDFMSSPDRMITLHTVRKTNLPFTAHERTICSMLTRALGPIMDQHVARRTPSQLTRLSHPQLLALHALFSGKGCDDETTIKRLMTFFGVSSREGLIAYFVPPTTLEEIEELIRLYEIEEAEQLPEVK